MAVVAHVITYQDTAAGVSVQLATVLTCDAAVVVVLLRQVLKI